MTQLRTLGGATLSPLCFRYMQFGGTADAGASRAMFDTCREAGVNHFGTAHVYTGGASETLLGQFINKERDTVLVATKLAYTGGASRANIDATFEAFQKWLLWCALIGCICTALTKIFRWKKHLRRPLG